MFQSIATTRPIYSNYHVLQPKKQSKNLVLIIETKQLCFFFLQVIYMCDMFVNVLTEKRFT